MEEFVCRVHVSASAAIASVKEMQKCGFDGLEIKRKEVTLKVFVSFECFVR